MACRFTIAQMLQLVDLATTPGIPKMGGAARLARWRTLEIRRCQGCRGAGCGHCRRPPDRCGDIGPSNIRELTTNHRSEYWAAIPDCGATPCTNKVGSLAGQPDPCFATAKTNLPISLQTTSITQQIALSGSTKIYVCSLSLIASAATVFSVTGGTGTNCGTPAALIGTTSASHGLSLAANGGLTYGNGGSTVAVTGAGSELCLVQSGAGDLSGNLTYVQQ